MAFKITQVVPWERSLNEYRKFFSLSDENLNKKILSCANGPSSFNSEMASIGKEVVLIDPVYQFSRN